MSDRAASSSRRRATAITVALRTPRGARLHDRLPARLAGPLQLDLHQRRRRHDDPAQRPQARRPGLLHGRDRRLRDRALDLHHPRRLAHDPARARPAEALPRARRCRPGPSSSARSLRATAQALAMTALLLARRGDRLRGRRSPARPSPPSSLYVVLGTATLCSLGIALTAFTPTADAASTIAPFSVVMLAFFSGVWIPVDQLPNWLETVGKVFPLYHLAARPADLARARRERQRPRIQQRRRPGALGARRGADRQPPLPLGAAGADRLSRAPATGRHRRAGVESDADGPATEGRRPPLPAGHGRPQHAGRRTPGNADADRGGADAADGRDHRVASRRLARGHRGDPELGDLARLRDRARRDARRSSPTAAPGSATTRSDATIVLLTPPVLPAGLQGLRVLRLFRLLRLLRLAQLTHEVFSLQGLRYAMLCRC